MRIIKVNNIKNEEHVKLILDSLKTYEEYLNTMSEESNEYEDICYDIQDQFCEIYDFLNISKMKISDNNFCVTEIMNYSMWDYIKNKISFTELLQKLNNEYKNID